MKDWTAKDGVANNSDLFHYLSVEIGGLIKNSGHDLLRGRAETVARLILAKLAHEYGFAPSIESAEIGGIR